MSTVEDMIMDSTCFGVAFDNTVHECDICEVRLKCEAKCRMGRVVKPASINVATAEEVNLQDEVVTKPEKPPILVVPAETKKSNKPPKAAPKKKSVKDAADKPTINYSADMPDFKTYDLEQLEKVALERGCDISDFHEKYKVPNILRMRLTMAIKKTYEV